MMEMLINFHISNFNSIENDRKEEFLTSEFQKLSPFVRGFNICMCITSQSNCTLWASSEIIRLPC